MVEDKRFWFYVDKDSSATGCWVWTGCIGKGRDDGYGRVNRFRTAKLAHRWSWELANGPIPSGKLVLHHCDNRPCVNPAHLFIGTDKDNNWDMRLKGRMRHNPVRGEKNHLAKLTEAQIKKIRALCKSGLAQTKIAAQFNICQAQVSMINTGRRWKHVAAS